MGRLVPAAVMILVLGQDSLSVSFVFKESPSGHAPFVGPLFFFGRSSPRTSRGHPTLICRFLIPLFLFFPPPQRVNFPLFRGSPETKVALSPCPPTFLVSQTKEILFHFSSGLRPPSRGPRYPTTPPPTLCCLLTSLAGGVVFSKSRFPLCVSLYDGPDVGVIDLFLDESERFCL